MANTFSLPSSIEDGVLAFSLEALENKNPALKWASVFNGWEVFAKSVKQNAQSLASVDWERTARLYKFQDAVIMMKALPLLDKIGILLLKGPVSDMKKLSGGTLEKAGIIITAENHLEMNVDPKKPPQKTTGTLNALGYLSGVQALVRNLTSLVPCQNRAKFEEILDPTKAPKDREQAKNRKIVVKQLTSVLHVRKVLISRLATTYKTIIGGV